MNSELLKASIETLKSLRNEVHSNVEDSVLEVLDQVIFDLETIELTPEKISAYDLLIIFGSVLEKLPAIINLINIVAEIAKHTPNH